VTAGALVENDRRNVFAEGHLRSPASGYE